MDSITLVGLIASILGIIAFLIDPRIRRIFRNFLVNIGILAPLPILNLELPPIRIDFVGRTKELESFEAILKGDKPALVSVWGPPGVGKSWLLYQYRAICERSRLTLARIDFRTAQYDIPTLIEDFDSKLASEHFEAFRKDMEKYRDHRAEIIKHIGQTNPDLMKAQLESQERKLVRSFLDGLVALSLEGKIILFFDTFERVEQSDLAARLRDHLFIGMTTNQLSNLVVVIAGWNRVAWENGWQKLIHDIELKAFSPDEVRSRIARGLHTEPESIDTRLVRAVYEFTDGYPLAVGLAAQLIEKIQQESKSVSPREFTRAKAVLSNQLIVSLLIERLLTRLPPTVAHAIPILAIPRWFDGATLRELQETESLNPEVIIAEIQTLSSFVRPRRPNGFEYHGYIRQLLLEKMYHDDVDRFQELNRRAARYYKRQLDQIADTNDQDHRWQSLVIENVYHELQADEINALPKMEVLVDGYIEQHRLDSCYNLLQVGKEAQEFVSEQVLDWFRYFDARLIAAQTSVEYADGLITELLEHDLDPLLQANALYLKGRIEDYCGNFMEATNSYHKALASLEAVGSELAQKHSALLSSVADNYSKQGKLGYALEYFQRALAYARKANSTYYTITDLQLIGEIYQTQNRLDLAYQSFREAYDIANRSGQEYSYIHALIWLSYCETLLRKYDEARQHLDIAIERGSKIDIQMVAWANRHMGHWYFAQGQFGKAADYYRISIDGYKRRKATRGVFRSLVLLAKTLYILHDVSEIHRLSREIEDWARRVQLQDWLSRWRTIEGHLFLDQLAQGSVEPDQVSSKYCEALLNAVKCHRYILDEVIDDITFHIRAKWSVIGRENALSLISELRTYWCTEKMDGVTIAKFERRRRNEEIGDGTRQKSVLRHLFETETFLRGLSNSTGKQQDFIQPVK